MAPGDWDLQDKGTGSSTERGGQGWEAASVHAPDAPEVQTDGIPWT